MAAAGEDHRLKRSGTRPPAAAPAGGWAPIVGAGWIVFILAWQARHAASFAPVFRTAAALTVAVSRWPGPGGMIRHAGGLAGQAAFAVLAGGASFAAGRAALTWTRAPGAVGALEAVGCAGLGGIALICTAAFGLGTAGLFRAPVGAAVVVVVVVVGAVGLRALARGARRRSVETRRAAAGGEPPLIGWAPSLGLFALVAACGATPVATEDALSYHLAAPEYFRAVGRIADAPHLQFRWPLLFEQWAALVGGAASPRLLVRIVFAFLAVLTVGWTGRVLGASTAPAACWGFLCAGGLSYFMVELKSDVLAAGLGTMALVVWAAGRGRAPAAALAAGAALGWAFCTKYTSVAVAAALPVLALPRRRALAWGAAGFLAAAGPFLAKAWILTGNPVFPAGFGGLGWSRELGRVTVPGAWSPGGKLPGTPLAAAAFSAFYLVDQFPVVLMGLPLLVLPAAPAPGARRWTAAALAAAAVCAAWWPYYRFMMPVFPVLVGLAALGVARAPLPGGRGLRAAALWLCGIGGLAPVLATAHTAGPMPIPLLPAVLGLEPPAAFEERILSGARAAAEFMRSRPMTGRLLLVGEARGAIFRGLGPVVSQDIADPPLVVTLVRTARGPEDIARRFRQLGVTRVALEAVGSIRRGTFDARVGLTLTSPERRRWHAYWCDRAEPEYVGPATQRDGNGHWAVWTLRARPAGRPFRSAYLPGTEELVNPVTPLAADRQIALLRQAVADAPTVACFRVRLCELLAPQRRWEEIVGHLRAVLGSGLFDRATWLNLAVALGELGRWEEARRLLRDATAAYPGDPAFPEAVRECEAMMRRTTGHGR